MSLGCCGLPGFKNQKYNQAFVVRAHHETDAIYHEHDFNIREDSPESPRDFSQSRGGIRRLPPGHRSQSEANWAYAKRSLARGDDPEIIIQRIADYRADDKADPLYYARHTVQKAAAELPQQSKASDFPMRARRARRSVPARVPFLVALQVEGGRAGTQGSGFGTVWLKPDVSTQLEDACRICADHLSKRGADVLCIVVEVLEFGVVEEVEGIDAELEGNAFAIEWRGFCNGEV